MNSSKTLNIISTSLKEELEKRTPCLSSNNNATTTNNMGANGLLVEEASLKLGSDLDKLKKTQLNENTKDTTVSSLLSNDFNLEVNTFNDPTTINTSPLSSSSSSMASSSSSLTSPSSASLSSSSASSLSSSSASSSLLASFANLQKISNFEFESILNVNEAILEIELRKMYALLDKLNWSLKLIASDARIEVASLLSSFPDTINTGRQNLIFFENAYLECNECKSDINLNRLVKKLKHMFEKFKINNLGEYASLNLFLLINKSTISIINLVINYKHECSNNNSNTFIIQIMVKKFLKNLDLHLSRRKLTTLNSNLVISNYNNNSGVVLDKNLVLLDQLDNNDLKIKNGALNDSNDNVASIVSPLSTNNFLRQSIQKTNAYNSFSSTSNIFNKKYLSSKKRFRHTNTGTSNICSSILSTRNENNSLILKAINKRKLQLSCTMCSSKVLNMSDHLLKKHSIRDRNMRKNLMDQVKDIYLSKQEHSTAEFSKKLSNEFEFNGLNATHSSLVKINEKSFLKTKLFNEPKQPEASNSNIITSQQQQNLLNQQRKMIKCPICTDENKYFVNISDHFIKIHHLITSEMRKPFLKKIKDESRHSILNFDQAQPIASEASPSVAASPLSGLTLEKLLNHNGKKINKRKASKTKKIRQQPEIDLDNLSNVMLKKENHSIGSSDLINVSSLIDLNQYLSENNPNSIGISSNDIHGNDGDNNENKNEDNNNNNENSHILIYDPIEIYKEFLNKSSADDTESALKQNELIELIIDMENNRYPTGENSLKNSSQDLDQEIKQIFSKRKTSLLTPRKHENMDEEFENDSINNFNTEIQESNTDYSMSKKTKFHTIENFNSYHSISPRSPSKSSNSPQGPRISNRTYILNKPSMPIAEINPSNFDEDNMNANYHLNEINTNKQSELDCKNHQLDEKESSFDSLDIEFDNIVPDNNNQNIINDHGQTDVAETVLNSLDEVQSVSLANANNNSKHSKQIHMNVDSSVKSSCPSSSPEGGSSTNYNPNQIYYNNYSSSSNVNHGNESLIMNNQQYTENLYDRFTNLEMKINSTLEFLTSFTNTVIKQLENTRNEIKTLKNELVGSERNNSNSINFNHHELNRSNINGGNHLIQSGNDNGLADNINSNILLDDAEQNDNNQNSDQMSYGDYNQLDGQSYNYNNHEHRSSE